MNQNFMNNNNMMNINMMTMMNMMNMMNNNNSMNQIPMNPVSQMNPINQMNQMQMMQMMNQMQTLTRLKKEFELCNNDSELIQIGCSFGLINNNYFNWKVTIMGPKKTPYEGGIFTIHIIFPPNYPRNGAEFRFKNKIYHLNVDWREGVPGAEPGHICLSTLNEWKSTGKVVGKKGYAVKQALFDIFCLFFEQGTESPYYPEVVASYKQDKRPFEQKAKEWTKLYAS